MYHTSNINGKGRTMGIAVDIDSKRQFPLQVWMSLTYLSMGMPNIDYLGEIHVGPRNHPNNPGPVLLVKRI